MSRTHHLPPSLFRDFQLPERADRADLDIARLRQMDAELVRVSTRQLNGMMARYFGGLDLDRVATLSSDWLQRPDRFQLWMMCSENLGAASRKFMYLSGQQDAGGFISQDEHRVEVDFDAELRDPLAISFSVFHLAQSLRHALQEPEALTIELRQGFAGLGRRLEDAGFRVRRGQPANRLSLRGRHIAGQPLSTSNRALEGLLAPAPHYPALPEREELVTLAALLIREHLADPGFSLHELAQLLCMSPRSLQRKLTVHGLSFSTLRDRERARVIEQKTREGLSKEAIGELLGYTDLGSIYKFLAKQPVPGR
ncbi:hypothetical protein D9M68_315720 [compost metagenome]